MNLTMQRFIWIAFIVAGVSSIFLLSWLPSPRLALYGYLPDWLTRWTDADENVNIRTAVPFLFLGWFTGVWLARRRYAWFGFVAVWIALVLVALLAEAGQLLLPLRHFDWGDVGWGAAGSAVGILAGCYLFYLFRFSRRVTGL